MAENAQERATDIGASSNFAKELRMTFAPSYSPWYAFLRLYRMYKRLSSYGTGNTSQYVVRCLILSCCLSEGYNGGKLDLVFGAHPCFQAVEPAFVRRQFPLPRGQHGYTWNTVTFPPRWYLFIYSHLHAFELLGWWRAGTKRRELTQSHGFDLTAAGPVSYTHLTLPTKA